MMDGKKENTKQPYVTGSSVIGLKYSDGVLIATDTVASYGGLLRFRSIERIKKIGSKTIIAAGGEVSDFQEISLRIEQQLNEELLGDEGYELKPKEIYSYINNMFYARRNKGDPLLNMMIVAGFDDEQGKGFLGYLDYLGTSFEENYGASGMGAIYALPLIRKGWKENMSKDEGVSLLEKAMRVLIYRDAHTINSIQIGCVDQTGISITPPYELKTSNWDIGEAAIHDPIISPN